MHWEEILLQIAGKDVLKEQIDSLEKDIPIRLVRLRQKDEKEVLFCEKLVSNQMLKGRDCDIEGCNRIAAEIIAMEMENEKEFFTIAMCSFHYEDYSSYASLDKPFNLKGVPVQEKHN